MMRYYRYILITFLFMGGLFMAHQPGRCEDLSYSQYSSTDTQLNIMMDYISDWNFSETRGSYESYAQVQFYGPIEDDVAPSFVVKAEETSKLRIQLLTLEAIADGLVGKRMRLSDAVLVSRTDTEFLNVPAVDIVLTYRMPLDLLHGPLTDLVLMKERIVVFLREGKLWTLRYMNPEENFLPLEEAFEHCISTLQFKE